MAQNIFDENSRFKGDKKRKVEDLDTNYNEWKEHVICWQGGLHNTFKNVYGKYKHDSTCNMSYPEHKMWAYLYELSWVIASPEEAGVTPDQIAMAWEIIAEFENSTYPTTKHVARKLLGNK